MRDQAAPARNADHRSRIVSHPPMRVVERPRGIVLGVGDVSGMDPGLLGLADNGGLT